MKANLLFPNQLFQEHEFYTNGHPVYLVEEYLFFKEFDFHKTKIAFHRATMKSHEVYLKSIDVKVHYIPAIKNESDIRKLIPILSEKGVSELHYVNPTDNWLEKRIVEYGNKHNVKFIECHNPAFINSKEDLSSFFKPNKKKFFQTSFYKGQRKKHELLVDSQMEPYGGKWTYDIDNRMKYPKSKVPPTWPLLDESDEWNEAVDYVETHFQSNPGKIDAQRLYPITIEEAEVWLEVFFTQRFHKFGDYEDAIHKDETLLNHSLLSPLINVGFLLPMDVVQKSIDYADVQGIPINSLEGFIRQIIGWREFIRGMYEVKGSQSRTTNYWNHKRKIPHCFYDGTTGIPPVDDTIHKVINHGYCHHIERLMIIGNFMLLCEIDPREVYRWFMELFIDAYDWVMVPNVYGMSQFA